MSVLSHAGALAGLVAGLVLSSPVAAQVSFHELDFGGKLLFQDEKSNGDGKLGSQSFGIDDVAGLCQGEPLGKQQKVFLQVDCEDLSVDVRIVNTDPVILGDVIGSFEPYGPDPIVTEKNGVPTSITTLGEVEIECEAIEAQVYGKFKIDLAEIEGNICPERVSASKLVGEADVLGDEALIDNGRVKAKKPNTSIILP